MKKRTTIITILTVLCTATGIHNLRANTMPKIIFEIGKNIVDTARKSGAPKYSARNVAGLISYGLVDLPPDIPARYVRAGYEIEAFPVFALTLYADEDNKNDLAVEAVALQLSTDEIASHEAARTFVHGLLSQFHKGRWQRYISELCPAVTGRSSFLNEASEPEQIGNCPIDSQYHLSTEDWVRMMRTTQNYKWIGEGVLATLTVGYSDDIRGITYAIQLEFEDFLIKKRREEENLSRDLAEGDDKGWKSTLNHRSSLLARKARITILEENAVKRGDKIVPRAT